MRLHDVPAWMDGLLRHNATNALFAAALASAQGVDPSTVRRALATFANTPQHNPGRYNFIEGLPFRVLLDYGHNPDGVAELCAIASGLPDPATSVQAALEAAAGSHSHPLSNTP